MEPLKFPFFEEHILNFLKEVNNNNNSLIDDENCVKFISHNLDKNCSCPKFLLNSVSPFLSSLMTHLHNVDENILVLRDFEFGNLRNFLQIISEGSVEKLSQVEAQDLIEICEVFQLKNVELIKASDGGDYNIDSDLSSPRSLVLDLNSNSGLSRPEENSESEDFNSFPVVTQRKRFLLPQFEVNKSGDDRTASNLTLTLEENLTKARDEEKAKEQQIKDKKSKRKKRIFTSDLDPSELTCQICGKIFPQLNKLKIHKLIHSEKFPFQCELCGKGFNNKYKMRSHVKNHSKLKENCKRQTKATKPKLSKSKPLIECDKCEQNFTSKLQLKSHTTKCHPKVPATCDICSKKFNSLKHFDSHRQNCLAKKISCTECGMNFSSKKSLKTHQSSEHNHSMTTQEPQQTITEWKCLKCPTVCSSKKSLKIHGKVAHLEGGLQALPYPCSECGKMFLKQSYLEDHQNRFHSTEKQFGCVFCNKRCATKQDMQRHLKSHEGKAEFSCKICTKSFVHRANYIQHVRSHSGEKPYKCIACGKNFGLLSVLKKHNNFHNRKGHGTHVVKAPKGRRGCISYIDYINSKGASDHPLSGSLLPKSSESNQPTETSNDPAYVSSGQFMGTNIGPGQSVPRQHNRPSVYIPSAQYIQSTNRVTPLSQMKAALGDYGDIASFHGSDTPMASPRMNTIDLGSNSNITTFRQDEQGSSNPAPSQYQTSFSGAQGGDEAGHDQNHPNYNENESSIAMDIMGLFSDSQSPNNTSRCTNEIAHKNL